MNEQRRRRGESFATGKFRITWRRKDGSVGGAIGKGVEKVS